MMFASVLPFEWTVRIDFSWACFGIFFISVQCVHLHHSYTLITHSLAPYCCLLSVWIPKNYSKKKKCECLSCLVYRNNPTSKNTRMNNRAPRKQKPELHTQFIYNWHFYELTMANTPSTLHLLWTSSSHGLLSDCWIVDLIRAFIITCPTTPRQQSYTHSSHLPSIYS